MKRMSCHERTLKMLQYASDFDQILLRRGRTDLNLLRLVLLKLNVYHCLVDQPNLRLLNACPPVIVTLSAGPIGPLGVMSFTLSLNHLFLFLFCPSYFVCGWAMNKLFQLNWISSSFSSSLSSLLSIFISVLCHTLSSLTMCLQHSCFCSSFSCLTYLT